MLLTQEVEIRLYPINIAYFKLLGYDLPQKPNCRGVLKTPNGESFIVKTKDLPKNNKTKVKVKCDYCGEILNMSWNSYVKYLKPNNIYYCFRCAKKLYGIKKFHETVLTNSQSFAQWGLDNIGQDFLIKYWDWEKNGEEGLDPWNIIKGSKTFVWIYCQEKSYHGSYQILCSNFIHGHRCPLCKGTYGKIHRFDSLGWKHPEVFDYWSNKNKYSPYEYGNRSQQKVWWKCPDEKHKEYFRDINNSLTCKFRCPLCEYSKGEERIEKYFKSLGWNGCLQNTYCHLKDKNNINYIGQKVFNDLVGVNGGLLSYDFYLPIYNLLIEYQGEFHDGNTRNQTEQDKLRQKEHDRRKRTYANLHNINLIEIWYWDFDNIEKILKSIL